MYKEYQKKYQKEYYQRRRTDLLKKKKERYKNDGEYRIKIRETALDRWMKKIRKPFDGIIIPLQDIEFDARNTRVFMYENNMVLLYSTSAFAKILNVTTATIRNWTINDIIPHPTYSENSKKWFSDRYIENIRKVLMERVYSNWDNMKKIIRDEFDAFPDYVLENRILKISEEEMKERISKK